MAVYSCQNLNGAVVTVFGGTGFIGSRVVAKLLEAGARVKVATRNPQSAYFLRVSGGVGQVVPVFCAYRTEADISSVIEGSDMVVNCTGILYEKHGNQFSHVHTDFPMWIGQAASRFGLSRFVHISALGVDRATSEYAVTKMSGERAAQMSFPNVTVLRPSVVFGPADSFFNKFASLARFFPMPLFGGGKTRFQPVYVEDVANAVVAALDSANASGKVYELGGPEVVDFKGIYGKLTQFTGLKICTMCVPWWMARVQAFFMGLLPVPPLTNDQITSLQTDSVVSKEALGLEALGVTPTAMDTVLPDYLGRYNYAV